MHSYQIVVFLAVTSLSSVSISAEPFDETRATTLFAFDNVSIPFSQGLKLEMRAPEKHPANPVVKRGGPDAADSWAVQFYGSVIRDGGKFRMWYVAAGKDKVKRVGPRSAPWRVAYAESEDGVTWVKPNLGLVEFLGNSNNNLVQLNPHIGTINVKVLKDDDAPDPTRRYKMGTHIWFPKNDVRLGNLATYVSPDGLTWSHTGDVNVVDAEVPERETTLPPIHIEPVGGLYKWEGVFYSSGQNAIPAARPYHGRVTRTFMSPDFVHWHGSSAMTFARDAQKVLLGPGRSREGEQIHEGNSVWNRNNVLLGISGRWHGAESWDGVTIDLGFVMSNDGLHFREPLSEWEFLNRGDDGDWDQGGLLQGQGFENVGDHTYIYYGAWDPRRWEKSPPRGGVGIATVPRDRFGDLVVDLATQGEGNYQMKEIACEFISAPIDISKRGPRRVYVNADGLSRDARLKIELMTQRAEFIPEYSGDRAAVVTTSGFQSPVAWGGVDRLDDLPERIRCKVTFEGKKKTDIRFSALYIR